jgi:hypothetical protein
MSEGRTQYTPKKISSGLDALTHKIAKIGLSAKIISPMFEGKINGKEFTVNRETTPLVIILEDAIRFIYGRLGRCYFDSQGKNNNTASINVLFEQIFTNAKKTTHEKQFNFVEKKLINARKYEKKLKKYCNKYFAHTDIKSLEAIESDHIKLSISWGELICLINDAKDILRSMCLVCGKSPPDFSEHVYEEYKCQFWKLIEFTEIKTMK